MKRLLFLTSEYPFTEDSGGKIRDAILVRLLSEKFDLSLVHNEPPPPAGRAPVPVTFVPRERAPWYRRALYPLRSFVRNGYSENLARYLAQQFRPGDTLWISRLAMAKYITLARKIGYRVILDQHNVESALLSELARSGPVPLRVRQLRHWEKRFCRQADFVVVTSSIDGSRLADLSGREDCIVLPNLVESDKYRVAEASERQRTLLFVGTLDYEPNRRGLSWFAEDIWPLCRRPLAAAGWSAQAVGARPNPQTRAWLGGAGIGLRENVPSMLPYLEQAGIFFIPLLEGGGTRLKAIEALAAGLPVLSTRKGVEGLDGLVHGENIWLAEEPRDFADGLCRLANDAELRRRLGDAAAALARGRYDWRVGRPVVERILASV